MFFTIQEMVKWLNLTVFELWINLLALLTFTITLSLKFNPDVDIHKNEWWFIFAPLFMADALNVYFCIIVFIRMLCETSLEFCILKLCWSVTFLTLLFVFKFLLCKKLLAQISLEYTEVFAPVFILLHLMAIRAFYQC